MRRAWGVFLLLLLSACSRGGHGGTSTATPAVITDPFVFQFNASLNNGVLTRWPILPITVDTGPILSAEADFNRWRDATGGAVTFVFIRDTAGVKVRLGDLGADTCAETVVFFTAAGSITRADITLSSIALTPACVGTITHEAGHSIGFLGHTSDGGLMDPDGGNGQITGPVADMMRTLYSNPAGTIVKVSQVAKGSLRTRGGLQSVTFVTPARRP